MIEWLRHKLRRALAGQAIDELNRLQNGILELQIWCAEFEEVAKAADWLQDPKSYPCAHTSAHGHISDFRAHLRNVRRDKESVIHRD